MPLLRKGFSTKSVDPGNYAWWINRQAVPVIDEMRTRLNEVLTALPLPQYLPGAEPTVVGSAMILNAATRRPRFTEDSGATWTDL